MRRRAAALALAGVAVLGVAGCGDRTGAAASPASSGASSGASSAASSGTVGEAQVAGVASAVEDAEALLSSIDAELAQDDDAG